MYCEGIYAKHKENTGSAWEPMEHTKQKHNRCVGTYGKRKENTGVACEREKARKENTGVAWEPMKNQENQMLCGDLLKTQRKHMCCVGDNGKRTGT